MPTLPYNTSKGAVVNFTRALAATLAEHNITVNCICPGFFPTRMSATTIERSRDRIIAATSLGRIGNDQDLKGIGSCWPLRRRRTSRARSSPSTAAQRRSEN